MLFAHISQQLRDQQMNGRNHARICLEICQMMRACDASDGIGEWQAHGACVLDTEV